jgi:hypothetical protein
MRRQAQPHSQRKMLRAESYSQMVMLFGHVERAGWLAGRFNGTCGEVLTTHGEPSGKPRLLDFKIASRTRVNLSDSMIEPRCLTGIFSSPTLFQDSFAG